MALHDWSKRNGWDGVHHLWITELLYWVKPRLPEGYRAYIGTTPTFASGAAAEDRPDVVVCNVPRSNGSPSSEAEPALAADSTWEEHEIVVATRVPEPALHIANKGLLIAAIELVSPRNKDRRSARETYANAYASYLLRGVHLLRVDVHRLPQRFSFADCIWDELGVKQPAFPAPLAISYRVGEPAPNGGNFLGLCRRPLTVGEPLPQMPLALSVHESVPIDLEHTYCRATAAAYLS